MSYLLDALRKSEARRRMEQAPGLDGATQVGSAETKGRRVGPFLMVGVAVIAVAGVAGVMFLNRDQIGERLAGLGSQEPDSQIAEQAPEPVLPLTLDEEEAERGEPRPPADHRAEMADRRADMADRDEQDRPGPDGRQRERVLSDPDEIEAELARRIAEEESDEAVAQRDEEDTEQDSRRARPAPRTSVSAPAPRRRDPASAEEIARAEELERRLRSIEERQPREAQVEVVQTEPETDEVSPAPEAESERGEQTEEPMEVAAATTPQPTAEPWRPGGPEYVRAWELPLSIRRNMPELKLTIHVYSRDEQRRFVLVNGQRFTTGDTITGGARLAEIRPEGAVIDYRDYRFLLEP